MRKEQLVFSHAACGYYKWVWLQVNFEGAIFAGRKISKIKRCTVWGNGWADFGFMNFRGGLITSTVS